MIRVMVGEHRSGRRGFAEANLAALMGIGKAAHNRDSLEAACGSGDCGSG